MARLSDGTPLCCPWCRGVAINSHLEDGVLHHMCLTCGHPWFHVEDHDAIVME